MLWLLEVLSGKLTLLIILSGLREVSGALCASLLREQALQRCYSG